MSNLLKTSLLIISFIVFSPKVSAQNATEKVNEVSLTLMGNGIQNQKTNESIALACMGEPIHASSGQRDCTRMRFVLIDAMQEAYWIGSAFRVDSQATAAAREQIMKKFAREKSNLQRERRARLNNSRHSIVRSLFLERPGFTERDVLGGIVLAAGLFTVVTAGPALSMSTLGGLSVIAIINAFTGMGYGLAMFDFISPVGRTAIWIAGAGVLRTAWGVSDGTRAIVESNQFEQASPTLVTQSGWNWAGKPRKVSQRKFNHLKQLITDDVIFNVAGVLR